MLEGLDRVAWDKVKTAYGEATDVPDMLRAMASKDADERRGAIHAAFGNIFHQGTRYTATPHAIPFIIELAARPNAGDRAELLSLVTHCVAGYFGPAGGPRHASGPIWGDVPKPMSDYGETLEILEAIEIAAEPAVPLALEVVTKDEDGQVRAEALRVLAALRRFADRYEVAARLRDRLSREEDPRLRALVAFALGHVVPMKDATLAAIFRDDTDDIVKLLAAMGAARRGEATPEMAKALVAWLEDEELGDLYAQLPGVEDLPCDVGIILEGLGPAALHDALPALLARLAKVDDFGAVGVLAAALEATFGEGKAPEKASSFTPDQMKLLTTLVKNHEFWTIGNATMMLSDRGLPGMRDRMAELVGVEIEDDPRDVAVAGARRDGMFIPQRAMKAWLDLVERFPEDEEILVETGLMLVELDRFDEARPLFERFFATAPETSSFRGVASIGYGNTLSAAGRLEEAYASFTKAQTLLRGENSELARQNRVAMLQQLGRPEEALAIEMERTPEDAEDFYNRGLAQVKAGKYAECIESIGRTLALSPDHANAHYTLACAYALMGNADAALASIARAIECDPDVASDIAGDSDFDSIKDDARFLELVGDA
jgi:tetratricopeptide (TPR) repeat protein